MNKQQQRFSVLRSSFTVKGLKQSSLTFDKAVEASSFYVGSSAVCALPLRYVIHLFFIYLKGISHANDPESLMNNVSDPNLAKSEQTEDLLRSKPNMQTTPSN